MGSFYHWGWGFGFGWIFMLLFWGLVIWAIIMLARNLAEGGGCCGMKKDHNPQNKALDILKERYAKGEISKEEFDKIRNDLEK